MGRFSLLNLSSARGIYTGKTNFNLVFTEITSLVDTEEKREPYAIMRSTLETRYCCIYAHVLL